MFIVCLIAGYESFDHNTIYFQSYIPLFELNLGFLNVHIHSHGMCEKVQNEDLMCNRVTIDDNTVLYN